MRILSTALLLPVFVLSLTAQPDTTKNFYPLQVGNTWQYRTVDTIVPRFATYKIVRDTLMLSGKRYYVFDHGPVLRIDDSLNSYRYGCCDSSGEFLVDKLGANMARVNFKSLFNLL